MSAHKAHKIHKTVGLKRKSMLHAHKPASRKRAEAHHFPAPKKGVNVLPEQNRKKILQIYKKATESELILIDFMLGKMEHPEQVIHFFLGAHIELHGDDGENYKKWKRVFGAHGKDSMKSRISSHQSEDPQFAIAGPLLSEALFGTRFVDNDNKSKCTWIQLESRPVTSPKEWFKNRREFVQLLIDLFLHLLDFIDYRWNQNNIGPYGKSTFTEKNPLVIDVSDLTPEQELANRVLWKKTFFEKPGVVTPGFIHRINERNIPKSKPAPQVL